MSDKRELNPKNASEAHAAAGNDYAPRELAPIEPHRDFRHEWWRCFRVIGVSGRYEGASTSTGSANYELDLRVDIDPRDKNSPVLDRVSGDLYQAYQFTWFGRTYRWRVFRHSWILDNPNVSWSRCSVGVTGQIRYWQGSHPTTSIGISIPWSGWSSIGPAEVTFTETGGTSTTFSCERKSDCFRDLQLEVDVCGSVNSAPLLPSYDTHAHPTRPSDLPQRTLDVESAYREAGIDLTINPTHTVIDDSSAQFNSWSPDELHDAMETHFSQFPSGWPKWHMWGLLAGSFDDPLTGGIMFDAAAAYGGAGEAPDRQGFAVFRNHSWFNNLPSGTPANNTQAAALRKFLYTWVHEAGHAFNFLHSWDKNRPDSLSWMNYDWRYDHRNGANSFWSNFDLRFDDDELLHLRHGDRASVIMGGDAWATGFHLHGAPNALGVMEGNAPLELLVRSRGTFDLMEPVSVELRIRNLIPDLPMELDSHLNPEYGGVTLYIRRPDGQTMSYAPIMCRLADPSPRLLTPDDGTGSGSDRYSEEVFLSFGADGFYFDQPGEYLIKAAYQGAGDLLAISPSHRIRITPPRSRDDERLAQDFFDTGVGMSLYLEGSQSERLSTGMDNVRALIDRYLDDRLGQVLAQRVAGAVARSFHGVVNDQLKTTHEEDPEGALSLTDAALAGYRKASDKASNLPYHQLVRRRALWYGRTGAKAEAKKEITQLKRDLGKRGVRPKIIEEIDDFAKSL